MGGNGGSRLQHQPALDGLRALAVVMVLLFHGGVSWMHGGYFGVSVFFTLSGFLITSLLVREFDRTNRIAPVSFYTRRAKRLLPASTLCLAVVAIMATRDVWRGALHVRRDALGALFQIANWSQLAGGGSYTDLQSKSAGLLSPLDHYWSLAIEEQFYWLWPLCFWGLARFARRRGWSLTRILLVLTVAFGAAAPVIAGVWGRDAAYWATPARAGEILIGALLAVALREGRIAPQRWMAPVFLTAVALIAVLLPAAGGPAYHGAFPLLAIASAGLLLGLQQPGIATTVLSWRPLVALGAISYGVYLFHFPVFVFMSPARVGQDGVLLLLVRLAVTAAIALASYWLIERPVRHATWTGARTLMHAAVAIGLTALVIGAVPTRNPTYWTADATAVAAAAIPDDAAVGALVTAPPTTPPTTPPSTPPSTTRETTPLPTPAPKTAPPESTGSVPDPAAGPNDPLVTSAGDGAGGASGVGGVAGGAVMTNAAVPPTNSSVVAVGPITVPALPALSRPVRIVVVGDSTAQAAGAGLVQWAADNPAVAKVTVLAIAGCGFVREGVVPTDGAATFTADCADVLDVRLPEVLTTLHPDVVMLMTTIRDVEPRIFDEAEGALTPVDHAYLTRALPDYLAIENLILDNSTAHVAWIRPPAINPYWTDRVQPSMDPDAHAAIEHVMATVTAVHPDRVTVIDLRAWFEQEGLDDDHDYRPDGIHEGPVGALDLARRFLGPQLVAEATR